MGRNPKIKLNIKTEKQLNKMVNCSICKSEYKYRNMFFYIDESNIKITENSKPLCAKCKNSET